MASDGRMESPSARPPLQQPASAPTEVRVDMTSLPSVGRIKAPPVCVDEALKRESMSPEQISNFCFALPAPKITGPFNDADVPMSSAVSSSSSTASHGSAFSSDSEHLVFPTNPITPSKLERQHSEHINQKVISRNISRNGRLSQRWHTDPSTQKVLRLVTGCVPIVEGGKILFVSASRKAEWILPKGGWEQDEAMEESAIRETFEEAGVLGVLGPCLSGITYETRKAKKRRLELEDLQKKAAIAREIFNSSPTSNSDGLTKIIPLPPSSIETPLEVATELPKINEAEPKNNSTLMPDEVFARIRGISERQSDETSSIASDASSSYTHVRMHLFPLYVSEVQSSWPESGRFRKVVDIDEAITMCESRPEFKAALVEIKAKNLHLLPAEERNPAASS